MDPYLEEFHSFGTAFPHDHFIVTSTNSEEIVEMKRMQESNFRWSR